MKALTPKNKERRHVEIGRHLYTAFLGLTALPCLSGRASAAEAIDIWDKASEIMKDVYTEVVAISTVAAIVTASIALLLINFSKSGRTVDESRAWLKRIITWAIINGLGFIMAYITSFFSGCPMRRSWRSLTLNGAAV